MRKNKPPERDPERFAKLVGVHSSNKNTDIFSKYEKGLSGRATETVSSHVYG